MPSWHPGRPLRDRPATATLKLPDGRTWSWDVDLIAWGHAYRALRLAQDAGHAAPLMGTNPPDDDLPLGARP